jgi:hypothetical protein
MPLATKDIAQAAIKNRISLDKPVRTVASTAEAGGAVVEGLAGAVMALIL